MQPRQACQAGPWKHCPRACFRQLGEEPRSWEVFKCIFPPGRVAGLYFTDSTHLAFLPGLLEACEKVTIEKKKVNCANNKSQAVVSSCRSQEDKLGLTVLLCKLHGGTHSSEQPHASTHSPESRILASFQPPREPCAGHSLNDLTHYSC